MEKYKLYINGEWKASSTAKYFKSIDQSSIDLIAKHFSI